MTGPEGQQFYMYGDSVRNDGHAMKAGNNCNLSLPVS